MEIVDIDWSEIINFVARLVGAFIIALPLALEREKYSRSIGLRTFPLVAVASCGYLLMGSKVVNGNEDALARLIQGLVTGVGFIGGGAILKSDGKVQGTATAASIWATGVVGASVALGRFEIAIAISLISYLTLRFLTPIKNHMHDE